MAEEFNLKVCTPQGVFLEQSVREVKLPSSLGEMGVLPGHADYTGTLGTGVMEYVESSSGKASRLVVSGGFVSFQEEKLLVLCDNADDAETVDREGYSSSRSELQKTLETGVVDSLEWQRAKTSLERVEAIDSLISH